jgi:hypothetical protein
MTQGSAAPRPAVSRRTVIRTGAHMAWAVPAVSVATAAPAFAAVSGGAALQGSSFRVQLNVKKQTLHVFVGPIKNSGASATGGPITVIVSAPKTAQTSMSNPYDKGVQNNWTYAGPSSSSTTDDYTFVSRAGSLKPNQSTGALSFLLSAKSAKPGDPFTYVVSAPGSTATAGSTTASSRSSSS